MNINDGVLTVSYTHLDVYKRQGNMWISGGYLNIIFTQNMPSKMKHLVRLVKNLSLIHIW